MIVIGGIVTLGKALMVTETLVELADRLNLLNLQIVAERSGTWFLAPLCDSSCS